MGNNLRVALLSLRRYSYFSCAAWDVFRLYWIDLLLPTSYFFLIFRAYFPVRFGTKSTFFDLANETLSDLVPASLLLPIVPSFPLPYTFQMLWPSIVPSTHCT